MALSDADVQKQVSAGLDPERWADAAPGLGELCGGLVGQIDHVGNCSGWESRLPCGAAGASREEVSDDSSSKMWDPAPHS